MPATLARRGTRLTVAIIAQDEARRIGRTLDAIRCADEVLVVDGGSRDGTQELCRARGARVIEHRFEGFASQRRFAAAMASHDWILSLDADEEMTPALNDEIAALLAQPAIAEAGFRIPMRLVFMGRALRHGSQSGALRLRLFDWRRCSWEGPEVHEGLVAKGPLGRLRSHALHRSCDGVADWVAKMNRYTDLGARVLDRRKRSRSALRLAVTGPWHFLSTWLLQGHVLDGVPGFCWSVLDAFYAVTKYMKHVEGGFAAPAAGRLPHAMGADEISLSSSSSTGGLAR